jgi:N-sulfoglucosamine sulfohydrolase
LVQGQRMAYRSNMDMIREMQSMYEAGQLSDVQSLWFKPVGAERLYDVQLDPFELNNLAADPAYQAELQRLRSLLEQRLATIGDWSEQPEAAMVAGFQPAGERLVTPPPRGSIANGLLTLEPVPGHSQGYRVDDGAWRLYSGPVAVVAGASVQARAVRYGWEESEIVDIPK